jgi:hypothetical protein
MWFLQAWAFASGARLVLGKSPLMNMDNFSPEVWRLHRRLFHRFLKYKKSFIKATENLVEYQRALNLGSCAVKPEPSNKKRATVPIGTNNHVIMLLTSSSEEEVSGDDN